MDSTSPRHGEKASYYLAMCLETGDVEWMELEGNSNSGTSAAFLTQLRQRHPGPLKVIWDNAPAPLRQAQEWRGGAGVVEDNWSEPAAGEPAGLQPGLQRRRGNLGLGQAGGYPKPVPGHQSQGTGEGRPFPDWAGRPEGRGATPLPDDPAIQGRSTPARLKARFPASGKCTSHLGFGLGYPLNPA